MTTPEGVRQFLEEFKMKMSVFQILFRDERAKNTQVLLNLELTWEKRRKIIERLEVVNFCQGPLDDKLYGIAASGCLGNM